MTATPQENAALVRRFLTDVVAGGDIDEVGGELAVDVVDRDLVFRAAHGRKTMTALGWRVLAAADGRIVAIHSLPDGHRPMRELGVALASPLNCVLIRPTDQPEK